MKKAFISLLNALATGLEYYGYYSANIYWDYSDDWYDSTDEEKQAA